MEYSKALIDDIKEQFELPCYVFDENEFRENYLHLLNALREYYPKYDIAYSYKTNYAPKLCSIVKELGGYAEVVSDMEYDIARKVGYKNELIIYNGPFKGPKMEEHLLNNGILNIDNMNELDRVISFASNYDKTFKVGIRVNISIGQNFISRFGIDAESNDLTKAVNLIKECNNVKLVGFHCHIGQCRSLSAWENRTKQLLKLADMYIDGIPEYIDLGSGMFGDMPSDLKGQFSSVPTYEEYACVTAKIFNEHYIDIPLENKPVLFTEPGTTVDNRYIDLIAEVDGVKKLKGKDFAILNCSIHNLGDVACSVKLPIQVFECSNNSKEYIDMDFVGYTCLERDVPYKGFSGKIGKGDYIVFGNVGGYSNVDKPPFILPQCPMIGIKDSKVYVIKRKETTEDILSTYVFNEHSF
ncbi:MAG: alanine racemase [Clostridia bacterium]|nr:alanine racemase [Clostridia bacterium]